MKPSCFCLRPYSRAKVDQSTPSRPQRGRLHLKDLEYILLGLKIVMSIQALQKEVSNLGLGPTKVPKWSQKSPDFASKSQISDSTFRWCWKGEAHSSQSLLCSIWTYILCITQCIMCMSLILSSPIIFTDRYFEMVNVVTAFFAFFACFFFHFRENNDKVPERSKNGPKKSQFCL